MNYYEITTKLIGPVDPVGETNEDNRRFENLRLMVDLIDELLRDVNYVAGCRNRVEYSVKRAGIFAHEFLKRLERGDW